MAAAKMKDRSPTDCDCIMAALKRYNGATYLEIATMLGWANPNKASRRLPEMRTDRLVVNGEDRACSISGNIMQTWWTAGTWAPALKSE
jgi:hypothetical protein